MLPNSKEQEKQLRNSDGQLREKISAAAKTVVAIGASAVYGLVHVAHDLRQHYFPKPEGDAAVPELYIPHEIGGYLVPDLPERLNKDEVA